MTSNHSYFNDDLHCMYAGEAFSDRGNLERHLQSLRLCYRCDDKEVEARQGDDFLPFLLSALAS